MTATMDKTMFTSLFGPFDAGSASPTFRSQRESARERLAGLSWPTARTEDWRFTRIDPVLETRFELPGSVRASIPAATPGAFRLVFVNGRFVPSSSSPMPADIRVGPLSCTGSNNCHSLTRIAPDHESIFTALNSAFLNDGAFLWVPEGKILVDPIEIVYVSESSGKQTMSNPRNLLVLGPGAQATVVERYVGAGTYFTNAVTEISVASGAILDHVKVQDESRAAFHIANTQVVMAGRSTFTTHYLGLGGALVRNEVRVRFEGEHAEATVNGLYLARGEQHMDHFTVIDHAKPNCASHELYKGILNDRAHGVFNGKIFVRKDAQKTDAKQTNKVLLLSDEATIDTKPQLEIFADDVKCTHGATVGQLDATQLFYLRSRGIPQDAARRLLTFAFANDVVGRLKIEALRDELEERLVH